MSDEALPLTLDQIRAAAAVGRLPELAQKLLVDERWTSLEVLLAATATPTLPLEDATSAVRALLDAVAVLPEPRRRAAAVELRLSGLHTATALARRADKTPLTARERGGLRAAAGLFAQAQDLRRAAELYEKAGEEASAAEAWGALGELERMEACLGREEAQRQRRQRGADARRAFETLAAAGERRAAIRALASALDGGAATEDLDRHGLRAAARELELRLCRGRGVSLRLPDGRVLRAACAPALLGREASADLPLREPTVSRRHAAIVAAEGRLLFEDAGSRSGTRVGAAVLAGRLPLEGEGELAIGASCLLRFRGLAPGLVELRVARGLDRDFWALVGVNRIELGVAAPELGALSVGFAEGGPRLLRPLDAAVRVGGQLVGLACDLAHGDQLDLPGGLRLEVL